MLPTVYSPSIPEPDFAISMHDEPSSARREKWGFSIPGLFPPALKRKTKKNMEFGRRDMLRSRGHGGKPQNTVRPE